ncbi:MAG: outer membrane lipoprotein carrier protein LolA [Thermodesulfobacteriota bacterium]
MTAAISTGPQAADIIQAADKSFAELDSYSVTLRSSMVDGAGGGAGKETIRYFYKKPGFVRMEFETPHRGAVLVYNPVTREVRLRPFGFLKPLVLTLSPHSSLIRSAHGHRVDESDIGTLLANVHALAGLGSAVVIGQGREAGGGDAVVVRVEGAEGREIDGVHRYVLWFSGRTHLPSRVNAYGNGGRMLEEVVMDDMDTDPGLDVDFFTIR